MSCHTWFATKGNKDIRTDKEIRKYLIKINEEEWEDCQEKCWVTYYRRVSKLIPKFSKETIAKMIWYEDYVFNGYFYKDVDSSKYHDVFRVSDYLEDILTSMVDVYNFMHKVKQTLKIEQKNRLMEFFREYPDGIIYFG